MDNEAWVERILRVVDYIGSHLDDELDPKELAKIAGFSLHHFHRVFRGMLGESVMGFVRRLRLERAAMRLKFSDEPSNVRRTRLVSPGMTLRSPTRISFGTTRVSRSMKMHSRRSTRSLRSRRFARFARFQQGNTRSRCTAVRTKRSNPRTLRCWVNGFPSAACSSAMNLLWSTTSTNP